MNNRTTKTIKIRNAKNECGWEWRNLEHTCPRCNPDYGHYHDSRGECSTEPCVRHGGPQ